MKKRLTTIAALFAIIITTMPFVFIFLDEDQSIIYAISVLLITVFVGIYTFGGLAKLIIYGIYAALIVIGIFTLSDYQTAIAVFGTLLFILNPLANFEAFLEKKLKDEDTLPLAFTLRGKYWPFFSYRKEMNEFYHLPQARKLFTKQWYLRLRQVITLILSGLCVFLFINELKNVAFNLSEYNAQQLIIFYAVLALYIMTITLYKRGFTSLLRISIILLFFPIIYVILLTNYDTYIKVIFSSLIAFVGIIYVIYEKTNSLKRVVYSAYHYYDVDNQWEVFANALYEPLVYNEISNIVGVFRFRSSLSRFEKNLQALLYYANRKHFIITAYAFDGKDMILYTEHHQDDAKKAKKVINYLEATFDAKVVADITYDPTKSIYEKTFFHKTEYIVSRTVHLAELLIELAVETQIIISMVFSFESTEDIDKISSDTDYHIIRLTQLDDKNYYAARVSTKSINSQYMIESKVRDMLLTGMLYKGSYVRVLVYY